MWGDMAIAFLIALVTAFMATPYTIKLAKKIGAVDTPKDKRKIHKTVMPRLGGLAVILGFVVSVIYLILVMAIEKNMSISSEYNMKLLGFFIGVIIIGVVCFIDDVRGVTPLQKLFAQILAAVVAVIFGIKIEHLEIPFLQSMIDSQTFDIILTIGWIVGVTNAINLIDGLDGLSSGVSIISCISLLIIFSLNDSPLLAILLITALAGSLVGFLPYNFNPAKTFIGDTGSNFLGYSLSIISILGVAKTYTAIVIVAPLIVLALPVFDTIMAIFRRIIKGKSIKAIVQADAGHLHHRILKKGFTQKQAVLILYGISAIFGVFAIILLESGIWKAISFALIITSIVGMGYKEFFRQKLLIGTDHDTELEENTEVQSSCEEKIKEEKNLKKLT